MLREACFPPGERGRSVTLRARFFDTHRITRATARRSPPVLYIWQCYIFMRKESTIAEKYGEGVCVRGGGEGGVQPVAIDHPPAPLNARTELYAVFIFGVLGCIRRCRLHSHKEWSTTVAAREKKSLACYTTPVRGKRYTHPAAATVPKAPQKGHRPSPERISGAGPRTTHPIATRAIYLENKSGFVLLPHIECNHTQYQFVFEQRAFRHHPVYSQTSTVGPTSFPSRDSSLFGGQPQPFGRKISFHGI